MMQIRPYQEQDSNQVGILLADCFSKYNLEQIERTEQPSYLGPFYNAHSSDPAHQQQIAILIQAPLIFVGQDEDGQICAILRATQDRILTLCVHDFYFFQNIGRQLLEEYEQRMLKKGVRSIKVAAPLYSVSFYLRMGYKRSTGIRISPFFPNGSLPGQPMKKQIKPAQPNLPFREGGQNNAQA